MTAGSIAKYDGDDPEEIVIFIPLQVFKLRYKMEQIKKKHGEGSSQLRETIMEAKNISETISKEGSQLFNNILEGFKSTILYREELSGLRKSLWGELNLLPKLLMQHRR